MEQVEEEVQGPELSKEVKAALDTIKKEGHRASYVTIANQEYIYRGINRKEWREIVSKRNQRIVEAGEDQAMIAEIQEDEVELITSMCLLYPEFALESIGAGTVQHLADLVLFEAGFGGPDIQAVKV
jgi:hypothetical protein